jgi:hypothetical protein
VVNTGEIQQTFYQPTDLPLGQILYARLWTRVGGAWRYTDSSFTASAVAQAAATLTSPLNGTSNADLFQTFRWTSVRNVQAYYLYVGSTLGANDLVNTGEILQTYYQPVNLPAGQILYARLWTRIGDLWRYTDSSFRGAPLYAFICGKRWSLHTVREF